VQIRRQVSCLNDGLMPVSRLLGGYLNYFYSIYLAISAKKRIFAGKICSTIGYTTIVIIIKQHDLS